MPSPRRRPLVMEQPPAHTWAGRLTSRTIVFALSLLVFVALAALFFDHTVDDAFIGYRYAENLVLGHGLVFNPGERVEGYTNFLWVLLVAPCMLFGFDPEIAGRVLGLLAAAGTLAAIVRLAPRPPRSPEIVWVAPLLLATSPPFAVWATGGMETPLYAGLVLWALLLAQEDLERGRVGPASALAAAAGALTRPEGLGVALLIGALLSWRHRPPAGRRRDLARWWVALAAIIGPHLLWRLVYYGSLLPNTFHAKVGTDPSQLVRGLDYLHQFCLESGYWLLLPLAGLARPGRWRAIGIPGPVTIALAGAVVLVGGDGLPMYRFLVPVLPMLFLMVAHGAAGIVERLGAGRAVRVAASILALALGARAALPALDGPSARYVDQDRREVAAWKEIGRHFAAIAPAGASIAVIPAGAVPFYSKLAAIDMLGLNDRVIARRRMPALGRGQAGHEKHDVDYVLSRRPTYVLIGVYGLSRAALPTHELVRPFYTAEMEMLRSPRFSAAYRLERGRTPSGDFAYFSRVEGQGG